MRLNLSCMVTVFLLLVQPIAFAQEFEENNQETCIDEGNQEDGCTAYTTPNGNIILSDKEGIKNIYSSNDVVEIPSIGGPYMVVMDEGKETTISHEGVKYILERGEVIFYPSLPIASKEGSYPTIQISNERGNIRKITFGSDYEKVFFSFEETTLNEKNVITVESNGEINAKCSDCFIEEKEKGAFVKNGEVRCSFDGCPDGIRVNDKNSRDMVISENEVSSCPSKNEGVTQLTGKVGLIGCVVMAAFVGAGIVIVNKIMSKKDELGSRNQQLEEILGKPKPPVNANSQS